MDYLNMNFRNLNLKVLSLLILVIFSAIFFISRVSAITENVIVSGNIYSCDFEFIAQPEKRIPPVNNWDTDINLQLFDSVNTLVGNLDLTTDFTGYSATNLCSNGINLVGGDYDFYLRGKSHLRKNFDGINAFDTQQESINFTSIEGLLLAGETSNVYDNYINTLDISTQVKTLYSNDDKNDLNQDGEVNSLDVSNTVFNFYLKGDCSPIEIQNDICK